MSINNPLLSLADTASDTFIVPAAAGVGPVASGPIETRALSAAALRAFTDGPVSEASDKLQEITDAAEEFLQKSLGKLKPEVEAAWEVPALRSGGEGFKLAQATAERLQRALEIVEGDLAKRRSEQYMTTRDVHRHVIKPATDSQLCRYVELPQWTRGMDAQGHPFVGVVDYFVSHSWETPWESLLLAVEAHSARQQALTYYWVDIFAVCQHTALWPWTCQREPTEVLRKQLLLLDAATLGTRAAASDVTDAEVRSSTDAATADELEGELKALAELVIRKEMNQPGCISCPGCAKVAEDMHDWATADPANPKGFERVIRHAGKTLLVMEPWHSPRVPTRVWCLYESYTTLAPNDYYAGGTVEVALGRKQQDSARENLAMNFGALQAAIDGIDAAKAEATVEADRTQIFAAIENLPGGFDGLNAAIVTALRRWLVTTGEDVLARTDPARPLLTASELETEAAEYGRWSARKTRLLDRCPRLTWRLGNLVLLLMVGTLAALLAAAFFWTGGWLRLAGALAVSALAVGLSNHKLLLHRVLDRHMSGLRLPLPRATCGSVTSARRAGYIEGLVGAIGLPVGMLGGTYVGAVLDEQLKAYVCYEDGLPGGLLGWFAGLVAAAAAAAAANKAIEGPIMAAVRFHLMGRTAELRRAAEPAAAAEQLREAHDGLLRYQGRGDPCAWTFAPSLVAALRAAGRDADAAVLAAQLLAAAERPWWRRVAFDCCHSDGRWSWYPRWQKPDGAIEAGLWRRQAAEVLAAKGDDHGALEALQEAAGLGCGGGAVSAVVGALLERSGDDQVARVFTLQAEAEEKEVAERSRRCCGCCDRECQCKHHTCCAVGMITLTNLACLALMIVLMRPTDDPDHAARRDPGPERNGERRGSHPFA
jgi:hypothetical protein